MMITVTHSDQLRQLVGRSLLEGRYLLQSRIVPDNNSIVVYQAVDTMTRQEVFVRVLLDDRYLGRIRNEINLAWALQQPHFVAIEQANLSGETLDDGTVVRYVVIKRLTGPSLRDLIRNERTRRMSIYERVELGAEILNAVAPSLHGMHQVSVVHGNLHAESIILHKEDTDRTEPYIVEFGLTHHVGAPRAEPEAYIAPAPIASDLRLGVPAYMAPEQWTNGVCDGRADQYSLAIVLYELINGGVSPFHNVLYARPEQAQMGDSTLISSHTIWRMIHTGESPSPLTDLVPDVVPEVWAVLERALSKRADQRYATMLDFSKAFDLAVEAQNLKLNGGLSTKSPAQTQVHLTQLLSDVQEAEKAASTGDDPVAKERMIDRLPAWLRVLLIALILICTSLMLILITRQPV